ncbi:MAG: tRNA lysidine(34) synthetase TilS, partial [Lysobacteraceae bacterium]
MDAFGRALLPLPEAPIAVGFSGGVDSTTLLHALASSVVARAQGLRAIHVHHGLHPDADAWAAHCGRLCADLDVPLQVARVQVDHTAGSGPEGAARAARLGVFSSNLSDGEVLALAHHRDDQAETILLRLMRGAGGDGLAAMRRRSRLGSLHLWRPLLDLPRSALRDYAMTHALRWIEDPSNTDAGYDRNFLRNRVLPLLTERWPQASRNLARSAGLLAEQSDLLAAASDAMLNRLLDADTAICVHALLAQSRRQRARLLRAWLRRLHFPAMTAAILSSIEGDLLPARADGDACVEWAGVALYRWRDRLHAQRQTIPLQDDWNVTWDGRKPLQLPDGASLALISADAFESPVTVRARHGGERIHLPHREHSHALK